MSVTPGSENIQTPWGTFPSQRYLFGFEDGNKVTLKKHASIYWDYLYNTNLPSDVMYVSVSEDVASAPFTGDSVALRAVFQANNECLFQFLNNGEWITLYVGEQLGGRREAGLFLTNTTGPTQTGFSYLGVADAGYRPITAIDVARVTEIGRHTLPSGDPLVYVEITNLGNQSVPLHETNLGHWGELMDEFLAPGETVIFTNDIAAFHAMFGSGIRALDLNMTRITPQENGSQLLGAGYQAFYFEWPVSGTLHPSASDLDFNTGVSNGLFVAPASPGQWTIPDADHDGAPDHLEMRFGSDLNDPYSRNSATTSVENGNLVVRFPSAPGRNYRIEYTDDLTLPWIPTAWVVGTGLTMTHQEALSATPGARFYRVVAPFKHPIWQ